MLAFPEIAPEVRRAGLLRPWERVAPRPPGAGTGRGPVGVSALADGTPVLVKQYRRGGALARLNPEHYLRTGRFRRELSVGRQAREAGLPVGEMLAVVLRRTGAGMRAWGIARYLPEHTDAARCLAGGLAPEAAEPLWLAVLELLARAGHAGLEHRDFNLGNVLVRRCDDRGWTAAMIDLDRASWLGRPLPPWRVRRMHARLERSWRKHVGDGPLDTAARARIAEAAGVAPLGRRDDRVSPPAR